MIDGNMHGPTKIRSLARDLIARVQQVAEWGWQKLDSIGRLLVTAWHNAVGRGIKATRKYGAYEEYIRHQKEKTTDPERIRKWKEEEWQPKLDGFRDIFERNRGYIHGRSRALCLGARTGQEVKALWEIGIDAVGVDLVPFPPYTVEGDFHDLAFDDETFDLVFTNVFDHALYPGKFCEEMERVLVPEGIVMIHLLIGYQGDQYTETMVYDSGPVKNLFKNMSVLEDRPIRNTFDQMNWELILSKNRRKRKRVD